MKRLTASALLLVASLFVSSALAQTVAPTPRALELSRRYIAAVKMDSVMDMNAAVMAQQIARARSVGGVADPDTQALDLAMAESLQALKPLILDRGAVILAAKFTEPELESLVTFFESPIGRSVTTKSAQLGPEMSALMAELIPALNADLSRRVCARRPASAVCDTAKRIAKAPGA